MLLLAQGKQSTGKQPGNMVLQTEAHVTRSDVMLAAFAGMIVKAAIGWWWADPPARPVIVDYGFQEGRAAWQRGGPGSEKAPSA